MASASKQRAHKADGVQGPAPTQRDLYDEFVQEFRDAQPRTLDIAEILRGKIVLWRNGLEHMNLLQSFQQIALAGIAKTVSTASAERVQQDGLAAIHRHLSVTQLHRLDQTLIADFSRVARSFLHALLGRVRHDGRRSLHYGPSAWVRMLVPDALTLQHLDLIGQDVGHLVAHDPHRDSWFSQAINVVNVWIALAAVSRENGILLFPQVYGEPLLTTDLRLSPKQSIGLPLGFDLQAGDMLIFHGDHLHSSALNITSDTRFVVSFRFTSGVPRYFHHNTRYRYRPLRTTATLRRVR